MGIRCVQTCLLIACEPTGKYRIPSFDYLTHEAGVLQNRMLRLTLMSS